jgi:hypothetical protein
MKTFSQFMTLCEATYDKEVMSGSQIRTMGTGGRVSPERKKSTPEIRRTKRVGGGQVKPVSYKPRKDIGTQKTAAERQQQPEKERGSAALSPKEAQRKAYLERKAREASASKPKAKELEKKATQLLSKKATDKPKASTPAKDERFSSSRKPEEHMIKGKYSKEEKKKLVRAGKRLQRDISKGVDKPASHYKP